LPGTLAAGSESAEPISTDGRRRRSDGVNFQTNGADGRSRPLIVRAAGMNFYRIPMTAHVVPTPDQIALFLSIVTDPIQLPVYVHCRAGKHWTGVMTAIYRMETNGWNADQAFEEMKRYRYGWDFLHPQFK
jgi:protein tyrosine/serine phosphatase